MLPPLVGLWLAARRLLGRGTGGAAVLRLALTATAGQVALCLAIGHRHGWPVRDAALQPLGAFLLPGLLLDSWRRHRSGGVTWRGRACVEPRAGRPNPSRAGR